LLEITLRAKLGDAEQDSWLGELEPNLTYKRKSLNGIFLQLYLTAYLSLLDVGLIPHITFLFTESMMHKSKLTSNFLSRKHIRLLSFAA